MGKDKNVLYLGNLRRDLHVADLKNNLLDLFCEYIGIEIHWNDIEIRKGKNAWFAFVDLHNEREASETLEELASWENRKHLRYNFLHIVPPLESLAVDYKKMKKVKKNKKDKSENNEKEDKQASGSKSKTAESKNSAKDSSSNVDKGKKESQSSGPEKPSQNKGKNAKTNGQGPEKTSNIQDQVTKTKTDDALKSPSKNSTPNGTIISEGKATDAAVNGTINGGSIDEDRQKSANDKDQSTERNEGKQVASSAMTSSTSTDEQGMPSSYRVGQSLGSETRNKEFKLGGGNYQNKELREHVCKYICGFLNCGEVGVLFIGVDDKGTVVGLDIDHGQEDRCRLTIDEAMKTMKPVIFPDMYSVHFVPVVSDREENNDNLKVIEIKVKAVEDRDVLYTSNGDVYIRRDGSVQGPLKGAEIQEWTKQKCVVDTE